MADELSEVLGDWKTSELRVTHGRAQSLIESADLATYINTALHKHVKDHAPSGEQMFAEVPREAHPLLHDALRPAMYAILDRHSDTNFEICNQAALRLSLQGQRQMTIFPSEALKTFLTHAMGTDGNHTSNKVALCLLFDHKTNSYKTIRPCTRLTVSVSSTPPRMTSFLHI